MRIACSSGPPGLSRRSNTRRFMPCALSFSSASPTSLSDVSEKSPELDVAGLRVEHERAADGDDVDFVALDVHVDQLVVAGTADRDVDLRALRSLQLLGGLFRRPVLGVLALDARDDVAAADAGAVRRRALEQRHDGDVAVDRLDREADAVVLALLPLAHLRVLLGVEEAGVRVEGLEHAADGVVNQPVGRRRGSTYSRSIAASAGRKDPILLGNLVLGGLGGAADEPADQGRKQDGQGRHGEKPGSTHR